MKNKFINTISFCLFFGFIIAQGDGTMSYSVEAVPVPGSTSNIIIKLNTTVAYTQGSQINFKVNLPPMTSIATFTPAISGLVAVGTNEYGVTSTLPSISPGTPITIATFTFTSTAPPGSTGDFTIVNDGTNYIEYGTPSEDRSGIPSSTALGVLLPIHIKTFSATKDGDRNARLDWSTSLEINSAYFGIERSTDGNTWEAISKVAAAGNSNTEQFYTYTDRELPLNRSKDQIFYYRLQLVDLDGWYKYSDIRGVNFGKENTNKVISLYPNPAVQMVNLDLSGMDLESGAIHLRVTDMQGRNMIDKTILGNGIEPIEVTQLPAGTYNVAVSQGANLYQKQFIKIE